MGRAWRLLHYLQRIGWSTHKHIRAQPWGTTMVLIAVTGWGQDEDRARSRVAGFDLHLVKPVDPQRLIEAFAGLLVRTQ